MLTTQLFLLNHSMQLLMVSSLYMECYAKLAATTSAASWYYGIWPCQCCPKPNPHKARSGMAPFEFVSQPWFNGQEEVKTNIVSTCSRYRMSNEQLYRLCFSWAFHNSSPRPLWFSRKFAWEIQRATLIWILLQPIKSLLAVQLRYFSCVTAKLCNAAFPITLFQLVKMLSKYCPIMATGHGSIG